MEKWIRDLGPFFNKNGLVGFNMNNIAEYLNISKATIYNHFASKDEIIEEYISLKCDSIYEIDLLVVGENSVFECYRRLLFSLVVIMNDINPQVRNELQLRYPQQWGLLMKSLDASLNKLKKLYINGMKQGEFVSINPRLVSICDRSMIMELSDSDHLKENGLTLKEAFDEYMVLRKNGMVRGAAFQPEPVIVV